MALSKRCSSPKVQIIPYNGTSVKGWLVSVHDESQVQQVHHIFTWKLTDGFDSMHGASIPTTEVFLDGTPQPRSV